MIDISEDPIVIKLIAHAKERKTLTWDELTDLLPEKMTSSETVMDRNLNLKRTLNFQNPKKRIKSF